jgi:hypothetical protein
MIIGNKQVLVIDDDYDSALTVKSCLEIYHRQDTEESAASEVTAYMLLSIEIRIPKIVLYLGSIANHNHT